MTATSGERVRGRVRDDLLHATGLICFYNERVDLTVDGVAQTRPKTVFS